MRILTVIAAIVVCALVQWCAAEPTTAPAYPAWDGKETVVQYAKRANIKPEVTVDLGKGISLKATLIPAGKYMMGIPEDETAVDKTLMHNGAGNPADELPQHEVTISRPFYFGIYVVTQEQFQQITGDNPDKTKAAKNPAGGTWNSAVDFCKKVSEKTSMMVRLPTEAEWEYGCRAGTTTPFNTGATISTDQANYEGTLVYPPGRVGVYRNKIMPVGSFKANAWGLFEMHGNAAEWCSDWYDKGYYAKSPAVDPAGPESGATKVVRGGTFAYPPRGCRSGSRDWGKVDMQSDVTGFRVVVEVK